MSLALSRVALVPGALGCLLLLGLLLAAAWEPLRRDGRLRRQLEDVGEPYAPIAPEQGGSNPVSGLARVAAGVGTVLTRTGILSPRAITSLESSLASANIRGSRALPIFVGVKTMLLGGLPLLTWMAVRDLSVAVM